MLTLTEMTTQCAFTVNNFTRPASMFILVLEYHQQCRQYSEYYFIVARMVSVGSVVLRVLVLVPGTSRHTCTSSCRHIVGIGSNGELRMLFTSTVTGTPEYWSTRFANTVTCITVQYSSTLERIQVLAI